MTQWEAVIGLEVHMQLRTRSKLFCRCDNGTFGDAPNAHLCPTCAGLPGALPRTNPEAAELAVRLGLALGSTLDPASTFERKSYFYPDLPAGFQTTQGAKPVAASGSLECLVPGEGLRTFEIHHFHLENDAGKTLREDGETLVDLNRAGSPLIELVTNPVFRTATEAGAFLRELHRVIVSLGICRGNMERGEMRGEANVSVRPVGQAEFGTKTEMKNINSFRYFEQAIEYEIKRQIAVIEAGGRVVQETRGWDSVKNETYTQRVKEGSADYRYHPEPDLPPLVLSGELIAHETANLPELPINRAKRFAESFGLTLGDASLLVESPERAAFFEAAARAANDGAAAAKWLLNDLLGKFDGAADPFAAGQVPFGGEDLGELVRLIASGKISGKIAKDVLARMLAGEGSPAEIIEREDLVAISNPDEVRAVLEKIFAENPTQAEAFKAGDPRIGGWIVGQVMRATGGKADPGVVQAALAALRG